MHCWLISTLTILFSCGGPLAHVHAYIKEGLPFRHWYSQLNGHSIVVTSSNNQQENMQIQTFYTCSAILYMTFLCTVCPLFLTPSLSFISHSLPDYSHPKHNTWCYSAYNTASCVRFLGVAFSYTVTCN